MSDTSRRGDAADTARTVSDRGEDHPVPAAGDRRADPRAPRPLRRRRGHARPVGTTTRVRLHYCHSEPPLGALVWDEPDDLQRLYRIVGVEEVARPGRWNLVLERLAWETIFDEGEQLAFGLVPLPRSDTGACLPPR